MISDKSDLSNEEETRFLNLDGDRRRISPRRDDLDAKKKKATDILSTHKANRKNDVEGVFYALDAHWK